MKINNMFTSKIKLILLALLCCFSTANAANSGSSLHFTAWLSGSEEIPVVNTNAKGVFSLKLTDNRDSIIVLGIVTGLSGPIMGASIQESRRGTTGGALKSLELMQAGNKFYGVITGADLNVTLIAKMLNGEAYVNISTAENPTGEIRGQLGLESEYEFHSALNGENVSPAVTTNAYGIASFQLSKDKSLLKIHAIFNEIDNITSVKIAMAKAGENGSLVMDLTPYLANNGIDTTLKTGDFALWNTDSLLEDKMYLLVSTTDFTDGEIRGQMERQYGLSFTALLNVEQETEPVTTNGEGIGIFSFNKMLDTLMYQIAFNNLSGIPTKAYLYLGKPGETGSLILDITDSIKGNLISGKAYGIDITKAITKAFIGGNIYVNILTKKYPKGEIRGQLISNLRETYAFELCGSQEVPAVITKAQGLGIVSIDQETTNLHY
ncbi:MAG: CHRD domain-containing protein, partial [Sphingobacteriales bacterium]